MADESKNIYDQLEAQYEANPASIPKSEATPSEDKTSKSSSSDSHGLMHAIEAVAGGAGGAAALWGLHKFPALMPATLKFLAEHPKLSELLLGTGAGTVAATPTAVETGNAKDLVYGGALGAGAAFGGARVAPWATSRFVKPNAYTAVARTALEDAGDTHAASARLRQLAQHLRATARANPATGETVGDVLGPQGQALAQAAIADPNKASADYAAQLAARQAATPGRVEETVRQAIVPDEPYSAAEQKLLQTLKANSKPLYDAAYSQFPAVNSQIFNSEVMNTKEGQAAAKWAAEQWRMAHPGQPIGPVSPGGMVQAPSLEFHQLVKEYLDGEVAKAKKAVATGAANNKELRTLSNLRDRYLADLDAQTADANGNSPYAAARAQYSSDAKVLDALRSGRDDFMKMTPDDLRQYIGTLDYSGRDAFRSGAAESIFQTISKTPQGRNLPAKLIGTPGMQEKIAAMFEDPKKAKAFIAALQREAETFDRTKGMLAAGKQGAAAGAAAPYRGTGAEVVKSGLHSINPKLAALRTIVDSIMTRPMPAQKISTIMSKTGLEGADQLDQIRGALARLRGGIGLADAGAWGAGAGALVPELDRSQPEQ